MPWYLVFEDDKGNPCQRGPYFSHLKAQEKLDALDREGKLYTVETSNPEEATRLIKEHRIDNLGVTAGSKNMRHKNLEAYEGVD